jgi:uncharacterized membrane protein
MLRVNLKMTIPSYNKTSRSYDEKPVNKWIKLFLLVYGIWVLLPFLAPVFMQAGWTGPAKTLYSIYSFLCHQLPQRSLFLFGQQTMYSLAEIQSAWQNTFDPLVLRKFIGDPAMGWKIAWSDRMISFYGGVWLFGLLWLLFRNRIKQVPWWGLLLLLLPMMVDGTSHFVSDLGGMGQGYRDTNLWLVNITNNTFPAWFYTGDALGSFNSWLRWISGLLAGLGLVWFAFPAIDSAFRAVKLARKL